MGHIEKRGPKRWRVRYRGTDGKERSRTFKRKPDAEGYLAIVEADLVKGTWRDPELGRRTFESWADEYFAKARKRPTTMARDLAVYRKHFRPRLWHRPLASITKTEVRRLVDEMAETLAPATVRTDYGVLRAIFNAAVEEDVLIASPCPKIRWNNSSKVEKTYLTAADVIRLAQAMPVEYRPMIYLAGVLGMRWSEVAGLRVGRLDFLRRTVSVTETLSEVEGKLIPADV